MMKKGMRFFSVVLTLIVFAALAMGSGSDSSTNDTNSDNKDIVANDDSEENNESDGNVEEKESSDITIEEQVLLEQDGVKITAKEYVTDSIWGEGIKLLIENNSEANIGVGCDPLIVNNYMITDLFSQTVAPGKKANETMWLSSSGLKAAGIENVGQIEAYFYIFDADSFERKYEADVVTIKTSAFDTMDTTPDDLGQELFNQDGIRIVGKMVDEDSFWGTAVLLYIENTSENNVMVACDDMSVNGFMMTPFFASTVYSGKMAFDEITLMSSELEENDISSVDDIELKFRISNAKTFETIVETDAISFSTK